MKFVSPLVRSFILGALLLVFSASLARAQDSGSENNIATGGDSSNGAPVISNVSLPAVVFTNDLVAVAFDASDPDGDPLATTCEWKRNGVPIEGEVGTSLDLSRPGYGDRGDTISVVISVSDGRGGVTMAPEVSVDVADSVPTIASVTIDKLTPRTNDILTAQFSANDDDGDALTTSYQWKKNGVALADETGPTLDLSVSGNGDKGDAISVVVSVTDGEGGNASAESDGVTIVNSPPYMWSGPIVSTWVGRSVMGRAGAYDPDGDPLRFSASATPPTSGTLLGVDPGDSLFLFRPSNAPGPASFFLHVSDGESIASTTVHVNVGAAPPRGSKIYTAIGDSTALAVGATSFSQGYSAKFDQMLQNAEGSGGTKWYLSVRAISGFSAPDMLRQVGGQSMLSLALADNPTVVTVWLGLNDVSRMDIDQPTLETPQQFSDAYNSLITTLATRTRAKVVVSDVPDIGLLPAGMAQSENTRIALSLTSADVQTRINSAVQGVRPGFARVDLLNEPGTRANFCARDGFHPNNFGHTLVATKMFAALSHDSGQEFSPFVASVSPANASDQVGKRRTFLLTLSDANGATTLSQIEFLLNTRLNTAMGAYLLYSPQSGQLSLRSGQKWLGPIQTGSKATPADVLDNGAVRIAGSDVTTQISSDGATLSLSLPLTIGTKLVGQNVLFVRVRDRTGRGDLKALPADAGYVRAGNYAVVPSQ